MWFHGQQSLGGQASLKHSRSCWNHSCIILRVQAQTRRPSATATLLHVICENMACSNILNVSENVTSNDFFICLFNISSLAQCRIQPLPNDKLPMDDWVGIWHDKRGWAELTGVWIIMALWSRMVLTMSNGYTGWLHSIRHIAVSMVMRTPVRPIPALGRSRGRERRKTWLHCNSLWITTFRNYFVI